MDPIFGTWLEPHLVKSCSPIWNLSPRIFQKPNPGHSRTNTYHTLGPKKPGKEMWAHFCHSPSAISPKPRNINPCIDIYVYKAICRGYKLPMSLGTIYFTIPSSPETRRTRIYTKRPWTWTSEVGELKEGLKPRASRWGFMKFPVTDPHWDDWYLPIHGMVVFFYVW